MLPKFPTNYVKQYFSMSQLHKKNTCTIMNIMDGCVIQQRVINAKTLEYEKKWNIQVQKYALLIQFSAHCVSLRLSQQLLRFFSLFYTTSVFSTRVNLPGKKEYIFILYKKSPAKIIIRIYMLLKTLFLKEYGNQIQKII